MLKRKTDLEIGKVQYTYNFIRSSIGIDSLGRECVVLLDLLVSETFAQTSIGFVLLSWHVFIYF